MVKQEIVTRIKKLLEQDRKLSNRNIADMIGGVSKDTVARIRSGKYDLYQAERAERFYVSDSTDSYAVGRCIKCRVMVKLPCLACRLKEQLGYREVNYVCTL